MHDGAIDTKSNDKTNAQRVSEFYAKVNAQSETKDIMIKQSSFKSSLMTSMKSSLSSSLALSLARSNTLHKNLNKICYSIDQLRQYENLNIQCDAVSMEILLLYIFRLNRPSFPRPTNLCDMTVIVLPPSPKALARAAKFNAKQKLKPHNIRHTVSGKKSGIIISMRFV